MTFRVDGARFRLESVGLVVLVLLWVVAYLGVSNNHRWRSRFAEGPVLLDLESAVRGPVIRRDGSWYVAGKAGSQVAVTPAVIEIDPAVDHLLIVRAATGPKFTLGVGFPVDGVSPPRIRVSARDREEEYRLLLPADAAVHRLRLRFYLRSARDLEITGLEVRALSAGHRWVPPLVTTVGPLLLLGFVFRHRRRLAAYLARDGGVTDRFDRPATCLLILLLFLVFRQAPVNQIMDAKFLTAVSHSLLTRGSLDLPENFSPLQRESRAYHFVTRQGRTFHFFASAPAVLNAPIVFAFERAGISSVSADGRFFRQREVKILRFAAALVAAALCGVLFLLGRIWLTPRSALALTLVFAFGSQIFSTISRPYWSHSWASLLLAAALYPILSPRLAGRRWAYVVAGTFLSWSFFCRPTMALAALGATGLVLVTRRRFVGTLMATGMGWLGLFMLHSRLERGEWLPGYFLSSHISSGRLLSDAVQSNYLEATLGTLISPGRGQLVYVPITVGILFVVWRYWRQLPSRPLAVAALLVVVAHWQLVSSFGTWWGGYCFGPRLFSDIVVWLFLLAVLGTAAIDWGSGGRRPLARRLLATVLLLLVAASVFVNTRGAVDRATMRWAAAPQEETDDAAPRPTVFTHHKLWNWRHPQFLAGWDQP